jgi:hypothetical protein
MLNLGSNSSTFRLTSASDGVSFDVNGDGVAERVAWTEPSSSVVFLALDRNDDGRIADGSELFGTGTTRTDGSRAKNGFEALKDFDADSNGVIDARDPIYSSLRVWKDSNHDGFSDSGELFTLSSVGVVSIFTDYRQNKRVDKFGNSYRFESRAVFAKQKVEHDWRVFDVFLAVAR